MRLRYVLAAFSIVAAAGLAACGGGGGKSTKTPAATATAPQTTGTPVTSPLPTPTGGAVNIVPTASNALVTVTAPATVTGSGLRIIDIVKGSGKEAKAGSIIDIQFTEWLSTGLLTEPRQPQPVRENLTPVHVIQGWLEGIPGMKEGGKRRLVMPPALAAGNGLTIPANAMLIDDIELVTVERQ